MPNETFNQPENTADEPVIVEDPEISGWKDLAVESEQWPKDHEGLQLLKANHVDRLLVAKNFGHQISQKVVDTNAAFLHDRDSSVHFSPGVESSADYLRQSGRKVPNEPVEKISAMLELSRDVEYGNDGILTGDKESLERQVAAHVMESQDVPDSYFEGMQHTHRDEGRGDLEITPELRQTVIEELRMAQRFSLTEWASFLGENETYPDGFKMYVWDSITRLKPYDAHRRGFPKRSKGTVAPYPMFNPDAVEKVKELVDNNDKRSFANLYTEAVHSLPYFDPEILQTVDGEWKTFAQSSDMEAAKELSDTLNEKTGWCVAQESYANHYLSSGDFRVYYTRDAEGNFTTPRVAISMNGKRIREMRGIQPGQVIEPQMLDAAYSKASELPGNEKYLSVKEDMQWLKRLDRMTETDAQADLSVDDIKFLYEFDRKIGKVDDQEDPRIQEIIQRRDWASDMMLVYGVASNQELYDLISAQYDEAQNITVLMSDKKAHPVFGYSLNRQEKENQRKKDFGSKQFWELMNNIPYMSLESSTAFEIAKRHTYEIPRVLDNPESFGFSSLTAAVDALAEKGFVQELVQSAESYRYGEGREDIHVLDVSSVLLGKGLEKEILKTNGAPRFMHEAAVVKVVNSQDIDLVRESTELNDVVKGRLVDVLARIQAGSRAERVILPTQDEVNQFEQALADYFKNLDIRSSYFTPSTQRDIELGINTYTTLHHGVSSASRFFGDVAIVDGAHLRSGDLLFRALSRENPQKIIISASTKPYVLKTPKSVESLLQLDKDQIAGLDPNDLTSLYDELLEKEGMPNELRGEDIASLDDVGDVDADSVRRF